MNTFRAIEESQTLLINQQSRQMEQHRPIFKFGFGQSPFLPPDYVMEALRENVHRKEYSDVQGDPELRQAIAGFHQHFPPLNVSPDNVLVAPGSKILIYTILAAFTKADVFIPGPAWVSYAPQAALTGHHTLRMETGFEQRWRVTPESILRAASKKKHEASIMILNYPGNPDGLTYTREEIAGIADQARALNMLVIADEIYGLLTHDQQHHSLADFYPEKTITTTGLSKWCGAGGWRLGVALLYESIEEAFKKALIGIASETYSCAPVPVQMAAKSAYGQPDRIQPYIRAQCNILKEIGRFCYRELAGNGVRLHPPEGGFYLFPDFTDLAPELHAMGIKTSRELCERILEDTGVALLPASAFGLEEHYLACRLSYVDFDDPLPKGDFDIHRDCPKIIEGIGRLDQWLKAL